MEFEAVDEGVIGKILVAEGTEGVKVNAPIAVLLEEGESADDIGSGHRPPGGGRPPKPPPPSRTCSPCRRRGRHPGPPPARRLRRRRVFASPLARRIAKDKGLDLAGSRAPARMAAS
jgi:pyruvate dehydrogenase E2 component (dihydrolipoamide acetyltransferase)